MLGIEDAARFAVANIQKHHLGATVVSVDPKAVGDALLVWITVQDSVADSPDRTLVLASVRRAAEVALSGGGSQFQFGRSFVRLRFETEGTGAASDGARFVEVVPGVLGGRPVVRGTRIPADLIASMSRQGATEAEILADYPSLTREVVQALRPGAPR
jgi:uncharacterized protein (DUF433 family)